MIGSSNYVIIAKYYVLKYFHTLRKIVRGIWFLYLICGNFWCLVFVLLYYTRFKKVKVKLIYVDYVELEELYYFLHKTNSLISTQDVETSELIFFFCY